MSQKQVAICISGQIRMFDQTKTSLIEYILKPLQNLGFVVKIFAHFPKEESSFLDQDASFFDSFISEIEPDLDISFFQNVEGIMERKWNKSPIQSYLKQLRSIYMSNQLKIEYEMKNQMKFDWVIRTRFDNEFLNNIENLLFCDNSYFYFPKHDNWMGYNDRFCYSSSENMDFYSDKWNFITNYYNEVGNLHPESFLKWWIKSNPKNKIKRTNVISNLLRYDERWYADFRKDQGDILNLKQKVSIPILKTKNYLVLQFLKIFGAFNK